MGAPTKDELLAELKRLGVEGDPALTNAELSATLDRAREGARRGVRAVPDIGRFEQYRLTEEDAYAYNRERDGLSRFLKASRGGPLPSARATAGDVVPVLIVSWDEDDQPSGTAFMPGGGTLWVEGFTPLAEED